MANTYPQIWNGDYIASDDRERNKLQNTDFENVFFVGNLIEKTSCREIAKNMHLYDVKCSYSGATIHLIYQDLRSGDNNNDGRKRFQLKHVELNPNEQYFYVGGYKTGDTEESKPIIICFLTGTRKINETANTSSRWIEWQKVTKVYEDGVYLWDNTSQRAQVCITALGCRSDKIDIMHHALISRSLDGYVPERVHAEPIIGTVQKILYGTPGTGKSYTAKRDTAGKKVFRTTFHPDTDYASFVGAYKPKVVMGNVRNSDGAIVDGEKEKKIEYDYEPQIFVKAYCEAWNNYLNPENDENGKLNQKPVCLLIEELNRGNCAQIFGDLFQLLDRTKKGFSEYSILADTDLGNYIRRESGIDLKKYYDTIRENSDLCDNQKLIPEWDKDSSDKNEIRLCLPPNLSIVCTMNTSDQSLFPMDSAFKRRWKWEYVPIEYSRKESSFTIVIDETHEYSWNSFLEKINSIIYEQTKSEDKQMGNFFVIGDEELKVDRDQFVSKVMYFLWSEICKDNPKARKAIFVKRIEGNAESPTEDKDFTFNSLFSDDNGVNTLIGFMNFLGIDNIANTIPSTPTEEIQDTTE